MYTFLYMQDISKKISGVLGQLLPILVVCTLITPFVMIDSLFFPFITGKAFYFRILTEISAILYIVYALVDKSVRPRLSPIAIAVSLLMVAIGISTLFAEDPLKSFWSNYERMEGYITFLHLAVYFLIASSVLKLTTNWWKVFFISSMAMSLIVGIDAFLDPISLEGGLHFRIYGNLGNSTYLGIYSLAHVFIALYFIIQRIGNKTFAVLNKEGALVSIGFYLIAFVFNLLVMYKTGTRGSFVGLIAGAFVTSVILALFEKRNKAVRNVGIAIVTLTVLFVSVLGLTKNTQFVKSSLMLNRFAEMITFDVSAVLENQGKSRSLLWGVAWDGVKDRPVFGWGLDNFHYIFAKHYDPAMYNEEQWFDRSHNVFMDWLTQTGFIGLIAYLSLFGTVLYIVYRRRDDDMPLAAKAVITGGLVAYFGHNMFVFDNLSSYVLFFSLLAYIHQFSIKKSVSKIESEKGRFSNISPMQLSRVTLIALLAGGYIANAAVIRPYQANKDLITSVYGQGKDSKTGKAIRLSPKEKFEYLKKSFDYHALTNSEQIEQLVDRGVEVITSTESPEYKNETHAYLLARFQETFERVPLDPRPRFFLAMYFGRIGLYQDAIKYVEQAIEISPTKQSFLNYYSALLAELGDDTKSLEVAKKSYELYTKNQDAYYLYLAALIRADKIDEAESHISEANTLEYLLNTNIISGYIEKKAISRIVTLVQKQIALHPEILDLRSVLASVYIRSGNIQAGLKEFETMKALAPQYAENIDAVIEQVKKENNIK